MKNNPIPSVSKGDLVDAPDSDVITEDPWAPPWWKRLETLDLKIGSWQWVISCPPSPPKTNKKSDR